MSDETQAVVFIPKERGPMPRAFAFDPVSGVLLGAGMLDPDPEDPENWLIPYGVTLIAPPDAVAGKASVFQGGTWSAVEDHRGAKWYDAAGNEIIVGALGDPATFDPPLSASPPPPPPVDLAVYAKAARDAKEVGGITVQGVPIATDDRSKILIAGARDRALEDASGSEAWSATDGKTYVLPAAVILAVSRAVGAHVSEVFKVYADVKAHLDASPPTITTTAEIDAEFAAMPTAY